MLPETRALRQTIEALAFEGILHPAPNGWTIGNLTIRAPHRVQMTGRVRLLAGPLDHQGNPLTLEMLGGGLQNAGYNADTLLLAVSRSAGFLRAAGPVMPDRLSLRGQALEAALSEGHPYHPGFKARIGFSDADNAAYSPEGAAPIRPLWLAVDNDLITRTGSDVAAGFAPAGAIPVHPWQWNRLRDNPVIAGWMAQGRIRLLDHSGPAMQATASLRTLAPATGDHLKLALGVGVTSSIRNLVPWSVAVAPAISEWLMQVVASDPQLSGLTILPEHSAAIVGRDELGGQLAVIRRIAPPDDAVPLSMLSLTEPDGSPVIAPWLARHGTRAWVAQLLSVLRPVWHLMTHHGIALEAHGQNMLIRHENGWPIGLIARDFSESLEYVHDRLARPDLLPDLTVIEPAMADAPDGEYHRMGSPTDLRDLVMDCLVTHVLSDLANLLHRRGLLPETAFWAMTRDVLCPVAGFDTDLPTYRAESLAARLLGVTATHPAPNPLRTPEPMPDLFCLDDRIVDPNDAALPDLMQGRDPEHSRIALHLTDKAVCLSQILRLRDAGASCYPIHPETPAEQALDLARRAGCDALAHDSGITNLGQTAPHTPGGVLIQMSSGTTGTPKIIARSWATIATEINAYIRAFPEAAEMTPVIAAPVTHSYGLIAGVMVGQARRHRPVVLDSANPKAVLRHLKAIDRPLLYAAPPLLHMLSRFAGPDGLHAVMSSGTVLPQAWFDDIRTASRHMFQQYGCSEGGCLAIAAAPISPQDMGAPLPHIRITAGGDTPDAVMIHGAGNDIDTGDLGTIDARGHLIYAGRAAEVIDVAGLNVYPDQIEAVAMAMPDMQDAVAFAIPDAVSTQRPALAYVGQVTEQALDAYLADALSPRQRPALLIRMERLPRGANGKIARRDLAASLTKATA
ncbi:IucA/IucC family protein [Paracoccus sp. JM45]|uniref:IucA/IucC family protein n=1 Tax=Paracoccus sp. JM45 TaxID=2283626 RepID=UPI000E6CA1D5|nr:IucA/IucC family protein [Paracoccus sp. JM45]RJE79741.1 IucA/IucC family protein [Paracoccus sp. JM45]